jgi:hypothetical protein
MVKSSFSKGLISMINSRTQSTDRPSLMIITVTLVDASFELVQALAERPHRGRQSFAEQQQADQQSDH